MAKFSKNEKADSVAITNNISVPVDIQMRVSLASEDGTKVTHVDDKETLEFLRHVAERALKIAADERDAHNKALDIEDARNNLAEALRDLIALGDVDRSVIIDKTVLEADDSNRCYGVINFNGDSRIVEAILQAFFDVNAQLWQNENHA